MHELPGIHTDLGIAKLTPKDVLGKSDHFSFLTDLVGANDDMYPGIEKWFQKKVVPGIKSGERVAYLGMVDGDPFASAILKKGKRSKICHIKIGRSFQDQNLGELFFILMGFEVRHLAKEVYFTLPESLWRAKRHFFESFGFADATRSGTQYRFFDTEFLCKTNFQNFWSRIIEKNSKLMNCYSLNGKSANSGLLLSIKPKYADRIMNGTKTVVSGQNEEDKKNEQEISQTMDCRFEEREIQAMQGKLPLPEKVLRSRRPDGHYRPPEMASE